MKNESAENRLRVAAYIRVSTDHPNQEDSYEMQERYFSDLLSANNEWIPVGIYCDYGISATSKAKRIGFQRLMRHCEEGRVDRIVCKSISRFARNTADFLRAVRVLRDHEVTILFEKERIDTLNAENDFVLTALGAIAQEESRSISENIRWGLAKRYPKGDVVNFAIYGYRYAQGEAAYETTETGYVRRCVEIVPEEAEVVRRIFRRVAERRSFASIARELNGEDIPAPMGHRSCRRTDQIDEQQEVPIANVDSRKTAGNGEWQGVPIANVDSRKTAGNGEWQGVSTDRVDSRTTGRRDACKKSDVGWTSDRVSEIAHQERYAGDVLVQKNFTQDYLTHKIRRNTGELTQYYVKNHHPAIVDRALFEQVQEVLSAIEPQGGGTGRYPFSGRLVCAHCGRTWYTRNRNRRPAWYCPSTTLHNGKNICSAPPVCEEKIIYMFRKAVLERFEQLPESVSENELAEAIISGRYAETADVTGSRYAEIAETTGGSYAETEKATGSRYLENGESTSVIYEENEALTHVPQFQNFVNRLRQHMEDFQKTDQIERERAYLHHNVQDAEREYVRMCMITDVESARNTITGAEAVIRAESAIAAEDAARAHSANTYINADIGAKISAARNRRDTLRSLQEHMESYWEALEKDYECREKAIEWMAGLPDGKEGTIRFFNEVPNWVKAFALSITVHSSEQYTVRWFDDVETKVMLAADTTTAGKPGKECRVSAAGKPTAADKPTVAGKSTAAHKRNRTGVIS